MRVKDETGKEYGPYVVIKRVFPNYLPGGTARWECQCMHCGATKIYIGNALRFGNYVHRCEECGRR